MPSPRAIHRPVLFWPGLFLCLSIVILAAIGTISLRQDRALAELDARERAETISRQLIGTLSHGLADLLEANAAANPRLGQSAESRDSTTFKISADGLLLFPPPMPAAPVPAPLDEASLPESQRRLWDAARRSEIEARPAAMAAYEKFLASHPPEDFEAMAEYALALLWQEQNPPEAVKMFEKIAQKPALRSEGGLPLAQLAEFNALSLRVRSKKGPLGNLGPRVEEFSSNAVTHPTLLTGHFLEQAAQWKRELQLASREEPNWAKVWVAHETARQLWTSMSRSGSFGAVRAQAIPALESVKRSPLILGSDGSFELPGARRAEVKRSGSNSSTAAILSDPAAATGKDDPHLAPLTFWFDHEDKPWLAIAVPDERQEYWVRCRSGEAIRQRVDQIVALQAGLPEYFGAGLELAGKTLIGPADLPGWREGFTGGKYGTKIRERLDPSFVPALMASKAQADPVLQELKVSLYLTSPDTLFARQRARVFWFGLLIATSALAAFLGFVATCRAFRRQEKLNELKSNFVSSVSHELRAPIASVRLLAEGLEKGRVQGSEKQHEYFRFIVQECRRLSSLIENVLDFSRMEQGRKEYEFELAAFKPLLEQTTLLMRPYAAERGIEIQTELPEISPALECDPRALAQALINLLDNAIKHSPPQSRVTAGFRALAESGPIDAHQENPLRLIEIWVEDHGAGIPPGEQTRIFERFYRIGAELTRQTEGIGIGLSIVKHIVEAHHGRIRVESEPGAGSRFTIELPWGGEVADELTPARDDPGSGPP